VSHGIWGANVLIEHAGKVGAVIATLLLFFIVLFLWNFLTAPAKLQQEVDKEIAALKTKLNNREARQSAMARLWALRAEGTDMRNQKVVGADAAAQWVKQFENWHQRVLAEARTISPNFHAWLATPGNSPIRCECASRTRITIRFAQRQC